MLRWALAFFVLSIVFAAMGFTDLASGFADVAKIFFVVFLVLMVVALVGALFSRHAPGITSGARTVSMFVLAALIGAGAYMWFDYGMSAERAGRAIDRTFASAGENTVVALDTAAERASSATEEIVTEVRDDASKTADNVGDAVAPDEQERKGDAR